MANLKNTEIDNNLELPEGTTAQRPASPQEGQIRYNTDLGVTEFYNGANWRPLSDTHPEATGGTVVDTDIGGVPYRIHYFTETGTDTLTVANPGEVEVLIVGGGGAGQQDDVGGGGGAGGLLYRNIFVTTQTYTIEVGAGANRNTSRDSRAQNGNASSAFGLTALGGGAGGGDDSGSANGEAGGSGGGAGFFDGAGGSALQPSSQSGGFGNSGGSGGITSGPNYPAGGGGGAGSSGESPSDGGDKGNGGQGLYFGHIFGTTIGESGWFAGGGGGAVNQSGNGLISRGGLGGGGRGAAPNAVEDNPEDGLPNTGGGGGGGENVGSFGGAGGSGIVIIRYPRNSSLDSEPDETRPSFQPYNYARDVRPIVSRTGLVLELDAANPLSYPGTGTTWTDLSGNDLDSNLVNGVDFTESNFGSLIFDGNTDHVVVPAPSSPIDYETSLTYEIWLKPTSYTNVGANRHYLVDYRGDGTGSGMNAYFLYDYVSNETVHIIVGNSGDEVQTPDFTLPLNQWHQIVATRNGNQWKVYLNTEQIHQESSNSNSLTLNNSFRIATYSNSTSGQYSFAGNIAAVRLYTRALSSFEITQNFNATRGRYGI